MIITKVIIDNFKIYKHQKFEFDDSKLILLTGANGFGKTTLIDAVEWCLTGDIARLKKCYSERNSNQSEIKRVENKKGIIKNSNSKQSDFIKVELTLKIDNEEIKIFRKQKEDSLYVKTELEFVGEVLPEIKARINKFAANDRFYSYHVCDMYKSYDFLNSNRQEVKKQFEDFVNPHLIADSFSEKLNKVQDEIKVNIKTLENKRVQQITIDSAKNEMDSIKSELKLIEYPQVKFYEEENLNIGSEETEKVKEQLGRIKVCGYNIIRSKIDNIILYYEAKEKVVKIDELIKIVDQKESDLDTAIKNCYYNPEKLEEIKRNIKIISNERRKIENAKNLSDIDTSLKSKIYSEIDNDIKIHVDSIAAIESELHKKQNEIRDKEKGNEIITALSNLVISKEGIIKYKNENNNRCPLCGSEEKFSKISKVTEIAVEAEVYLSKSKSNLANMKKIEKSIIENLNTKFDQFKKIIIRHLDNKLKVLEEEKNIFGKYYEDTKDFFEKIKKVNIPIDEKCINSVRESKDNLTQLLSNEKLVSYNLNIIKSILIVLDYKANFENMLIDSLKKIQIDIKQLSDEKLLVNNFSFEIFNQKLLFINNLLSSYRLNDIELRVKKYIDNNKNINKQIEELNKYNEKAKKIHDEIELKKAEIEKLEMEAVGPYLYKIFTKVIKHTAVTEFKFNRDGSRVIGGATFTDNNGNNILNILSQGQLGVFMLAYFFANMFKRKNETQFKTYFVDDITSCMDDMNILSFVDIIKYQLYQNDGAISQFFFSTCDSDLEKLFIHKMKSFSIDWINLKFNSYAKGEILDDTNVIKYFSN